MNTYKFSIPVKISYYIDETNIEIESIKDIKKLQKKYDTDLDFVIDEFEYKMDINDENSQDDEEYLSITKEEIFNGVINDLWDDILSSLNIDYDLSDIDDKTIEKIFKVVSNNFNNSKLQQYYKQTDIEIKMDGFNIDESVLYITVYSDKNLNNDDLEDIRKYIDSQCSDGWGEEFEKNDISSDIDENDRYVYVKTWILNKETKIIK
ncbi:MAG: hypothetical protein WDA02_02290 [Saccharofermentanales bacterium]